MHDLSIQRRNVYNLTYFVLTLINKGWGRIPFLNTFYVNRYTEKTHKKQWKKPTKTSQVRNSCLNDAVSSIKFLRNTLLDGLM